MTEEQITAALGVASFLVAFGGMLVSRLDYHSRRAAASEREYADTMAEVRMAITRLERAVLYPMPRIDWGRVYADEDDDLPLAEELAEDSDE